MILAEDTKKAILNGNCDWVKDGNLIFDAIRVSTESYQAKFELLFNDTVVGYVEHCRDGPVNTITLDLAEIGRLKVEIELCH